MDEVELLDVGRAEELISLDESLERLWAQRPEVADVVKIRYFAGLTIQPGRPETRRRRAWGRASRLRGAEAAAFQKG